MTSSTNIETLLGADILRAGADGLAASVERYGEPVAHVAAAIEGINVVLRAAGVLRPDAPAIDHRAYAAMELQKQAVALVTASQPAEVLAEAVTVLAVLSRAMGLGVVAGVSAEPAEPQAAAPQSHSEAEAAEQRREEEEARRMAEALQPDPPFGAPRRRGVAAAA